MDSRRTRLRPQVQCFDSIIDDLDIDIEGLSINEKSFKKKTMLKLKQKSLVSSCDHDSSFSCASSNKSAKRSINKTDHWPATKKKRCAVEESSSLNLIHCRGSPSPAKNLSANRVNDLFSVGSTRCNTPICLLDDSILEEGEIRGDCSFSDSLPYQRPKLEHKNVNNGFRGGSYNLANSSSRHFRMPARFDRYCYSYFHKYVTVVLNCPQGCNDVVFERKVDMDKHLLEVHEISPTTWCVNNKSDIPCNQTVGHAFPDYKFVCPKCPRLNFDCPNRLRIHETFNHQTGFFACAELNCRYTAKTRQSVIKHFDAVHSYYGFKHFKTVLAKCPEEDCAAWFGFRDELNRHLSWHHDQLPFSCLVRGCKRSYEKKSQLERHVAYRHDDIFIFNCSYCRNKQFSTFKQLLAHHLLHHSCGHHVCLFSDCDFIAKYPIDVLIHYERFHATDNNKTYHNHYY